MASLSSRCVSAFKKPGVLCLGARHALSQERQPPGVGEARVAAAPWVVGEGVGGAPLPPRPMGVGAVAVLPRK